MLCGVVLLYREYFLPTTGWYAQRFRLGRVRSLVVGEGSMHATQHKTWPGSNFEAAGHILTNQSVSMLTYIGHRGQTATRLSRPMPANAEWLAHHP